MLKIESLKFVGEKKALLYHRLGIYTVKDLLWYFPRGYLDVMNTVDIASACEHENCAIKVRIVHKCDPQTINKRGLVIYKILAEDDTSNIMVTFFNNLYVYKKLIPGEEYILFGKISRSSYNKNVPFEINSPVIEADKDIKNMIPVYNLTAGITSKMIATNVKMALKDHGNIEEYLPSWVKKECKLIELSEAIREIHFPIDIESMQIARKRLIFDELLILNLGLIALKKSNVKKTPAVMVDQDLQMFYNELPFKLTEAQMNAIRDCTVDMQRSIPMNRLIQGDVGSGKTVVAAASIYFAFRNGWQSAFMVPTEILAQQHYNSLKILFDKLGMRINLLIGSVSKKQKDVIKENLKAGEIDLIIGTHALIQDSVEFKNLGLVVTDEQHRFGVTQRSKLTDKGQNPHIMVMSATPIPRTLAIIIYGDLDISIIDKLPPSRKSILTYVIDESKRIRAYEFVRKLIAEGRQAYIVCPLIEYNEDLDLKSVLDYGKKLKDKEFKNYNLEIIHSKTKSLEKDRIMSKFKNGEIDILVSTTVIEVGVDVPNAAIMIIEDADRFGLSQLHQLRGRVGRGNYQSYCILISNSNSIESYQRLGIMAKTSDGFKISEYDLELRGPGDFFGNRQHGLPRFRQAGMLDDVTLLKKSREIAERILEEDPDLEEEDNAKLKYNVESIMKNTNM